jgi:hypothetical protein
MDLHLISRSPDGVPPGAGIADACRRSAPPRLQLIDCRPDLFERLQQSWARSRWTRWRLPGLLLAGSGVAATSAALMAVFR